MDDIPDFGEFLSEEEGEAGGGSEVEDTAEAASVEEEAAPADDDTGADSNGSDDGVRAAAEAAVLEALEQRLLPSGRPAGFTIAAPGRRLIHEGTLMKKGQDAVVRRTNPRLCFLFSDVLLLCKSESKGRLSFKNLIDLDSCVVRDALHARGADVGAPAFAFEVLSPTKTFMLIAASLADKRAWMQHLGQAVCELAPMELQAQPGWRHHLVQGTLWAAAMQGNSITLAELLPFMRPGDGSDLPEPSGESGPDGQAPMDAELVAVDEEDDDGNTPLVYASRLGHGDVVRSLLSVGATVTCLSRDLQTPLHMAAERGHIEVLNALLSVERPTVTYTDDAGRTPLHCALTCDSGADIKSMVMALLAAGADANEPDGTGRPPLHIATQAGAAAAVLPLARAGAHANATIGRSMSTPLLLACALNPLSVTMITALLGVGAQPNQRNAQGEAPLHLLLRRVVHIKSGDATPEDGSQELLLAELVTAVGALARFGGRLDLADADGATARSLAASASLRSVEEAAASYASAPAPEAPASNSRRGSLSSTTRSHDHTLGFVSNKAEWVADSASTTCLLCDSKFGVLTNRRHHCRHCGLLVCGACSTKHFPLHVAASRSGAASVVVDRVCDGCFNMLRGFAAGQRRPPSRPAAVKPPPVPPTTGRKAATPDATPSPGASDTRNRAALFAGRDSDEDSEPGSRAARPARAGAGASATDKRATAQRQVSGATSAMHQAHQRVVERGERLSDLGDKTADMANKASEFEDMAKALRKQQQKRSWW